MFVVRLCVDFTTRWNIPTCTLYVLAIALMCGGCTESVNRCEGRAAGPVVISEGDFWSSEAQRRAATAIDCDAYEIMNRIGVVGIPQEDASALQRRTRDLAKLAIDIVRAGPVESSRLPLSQPHQEMYEIAAEAERLSGSGRVSVWAANPWAPLHPLDEPDNSTSTLSTAMMRRERRALAFNVRSSAESPTLLRVYIVSPGLAPDAIKIYRVNWTGNDLSSWAAAELEPLGDASLVRELSLLPGITQQVWIELNTGETTAPGLLDGRVLLRASGGWSFDFAMSLRVFETTLPKDLSLHFSGWDYTEGAVDVRYAVTQSNRRQLVEHLQSRHVDIPWALRRVMDWTSLLHERTSPISSLDTSLLSQWLSDWPDADRFRVHLEVKANMAEFDETDPQFLHAVAIWANAWASEIRRHGKSPEQFELLLVDEPNTEEEALRTELWANAIRKSGAGFRIWSDPTWEDPYSTPQSLIDAVDTIAVNLAAAERSGTRYWEWMRQMALQGKDVEIYACDGPSRRLDPYLYYRLSIWRAFFAGATGMSLWSFSDQNRTPADNEFATDGPSEYNYSPLFISPDRVLPGKHLEAAAEGLQDVEYLAMLQGVAGSHAEHSVRTQAFELLSRAKKMLLELPHSSDARWWTHAASNETEKLRIQIGYFLDSVRNCAC